MSNDIFKLIEKETKDRPVIYFPALRYMTNSATSVVLLSKLLYWFTKKKKIYKTDREIFKETKITPGELRTAKKEIAKLSFIKVSLEGWPPKTYYKFNKKAFKKVLQIVKLQVENCEKCKNKKRKSCKIADLLNSLNCKNNALSNLQNCKNNALSIVQNRDCRLCKIHTCSTSCNKFSTKTSKTSFSKNNVLNSCSKDSCPNQDEDEESYLYKSCYKIWIDNHGKPFVRKNSKARTWSKKFIAQMFGDDRNPYFSICSDENKDLRKKKWTLSEFEKAVKNYRGDEVTLDAFIFKPSYGNRKPRSRLLESFLDSKRDKFDFKGKNAKTAKYIVQFYKNQIGNPEEVNPGVFVNAAKQIEKIGEKYIVNPSLLHPENQLWYKFMQYAKQEMKINDSFIPAFISSNNFVETFIRKAIKNGALIDRHKGHWS